MVLVESRSLLPNNTVVSQAGITIGAVTPPKSLDIRSEDNDASPRRCSAMSIRPSWCSGWHADRSEPAIDFSINGCTHKRQGVIRFPDHFRQLQQALVADFSIGK